MALADLPADHGERFVALIEDPGGMLKLYELIAVTSDNLVRFSTSASLPQITIQDGTTTTSYMTLSALFEDRINWFVPYDKWEVWNILNMTVDTHPFHVHLVQFRVLRRRTFKNTLGWLTNPSQPIVHDSDLTIDENEGGWKDTVRVNPGEMVSIAARFEGFTGRYMYHCHILEHEDHEMMRAFVVMPLPVMQSMKEMPMDDGHGGIGGLPADMT